MATPLHLQHLTCHCQSRGAKQRSKKKNSSGVEPAGSCIRRNHGGIIGNNEEKREKGTGNEGSSVEQKMGRMMMF